MVSLEICRSRVHKTPGVLRPSRSSHRSIYLASGYSTRLSSSHPYTSVEMDQVIAELEQTGELGVRTKLLQLHVLLWTLTHQD